jgi:flagellar basal-body rod protein FlgB
MIKGMFDNGPLPALERMVQFTEARHRVLTNNIANLSNPYFKASDLDPGSFQSALADALDSRRRTATPGSGPLQMHDTRQLEFQPDGLTVKPQQLHESILFHDQSSNNLERNMQRLAENTLAHNTAIELIRNQFRLIESAIRERA